MTSTPSAHNAAELEDHDPLQLAPIPLATGDLVEVPGTGEQRIVESITMQVVTTSGETISLALEQRRGAWWAPSKPRS